MRYFQLKKSSKGLSLIEMLVVVALLGGLAVAISRVFFSQLRGTEKTQSLIQLRQAGDSALQSMRNKIRNAREAYIVEGTTVISCGGTVRSAGGLEIVTRDPKKKSFLASQIIRTRYTCGNRIEVSENGGSKSAITPANLTLENCSFSCQKFEGEPTKVSIDFILTDGTDSLTFTSTISLRNY